METCVTGGKKWQLSCGHAAITGTLEGHKNNWVVNLCLDYLITCNIMSTLRTNLVNITQQQLNKNKLSIHLTLLCSWRKSNLKLLLSYRETDFRASIPSRLHTLANISKPHRFNKIPSKLDIQVKTISSISESKHGAHKDAFKRRFRTKGTFRIRVKC